MGFAVGCERERKVVRNRLMDVLNELEQGAVDSLAKEILDAMDAMLSEMDEERLRKALTRPRRWDGNVTSLGEVLAENPPMHKSIYIRRYYKRALRKRLKRPVREYTLWWWRGCECSGARVPKVVYDSYDLIETISEEEW